MMKYFNGEEVKKGEKYYRPAITELDDSEIIEKLPRFKTWKEAIEYAEKYTDEYYEDFSEEWLDIMIYEKDEIKSHLVEVWRNVFGTYQKIWEDLR